MVFDNFWSDSAFQISLEVSLKKFRCHFSHGVRTDLCPRAKVGFPTPEGTS